MSDQLKNPAENADQPTEGTDPHPPTDNAGEAQETGNAEAARYRRRLRDAEAERDQLAAELEDLKGSIAEQKSQRVRGAVSEALSQHLSPEAVQTLVETIDEGSFTNSDGEVDTEAVSAYAHQFRRIDRRGWSAGPGDRSGPNARSGGWADVLQSQ